VRPDEVAWHWIESMERTPPESFRRASDFTEVPEPPMPDSLWWCGTIFLASASPHHPANEARHGFHLAGVDDGPAFDLLRHEYRAGGFDLVVTEGVNFVLIRAAGAGPKGVNAVAAALVNLPPDRRRPAPARERVRFPEPRGDDVLVSTDPDEPPWSMVEWSDRIDAVVRRGAVYLLCYKRRSEIMGFLHDGQWFDDEFRQQAPAAV
jgi:hypothetical protein